MCTDLAERYQTQVSIAERALAAAGRSGQLRVDKSLHTSDGGLSVVLRCAFEGTASGPETVVVKQLLAYRGGEQHAQQRFERETAALQRLAGQQLAPELLAADAGERVAVLEDISNATPLWDLLCGRDRGSAKAGFLSMARALGRMHALTRDASTPGAAQDLAVEVARLGGAVSSCAIDIDKLMLERVVRVVSEAEMGHALCHLDAAPRNYLVLAPSDGRLIDFELAERGHPLRDLVQLLWGTAVPPRSLPRDVFDEAVGEYARASGVATERALDLELTMVLAYTALWGLARGIEHGRFAGWERYAFAQVAQRAEHQQVGLGSLARACADHLRENGPAEPPEYPAFRTA